MPKNLSVILASDKTQLSTFSGDKQAWPVYLTIGNIDKSLRKCPSRRAGERSLQGYRIFHYAMSLLLEPLVSSGRDGIDIVCADGWIRRVFPILAACPVHPDDRGEPLDTCYRDPESSLAAEPFWANLPHTNIFTCIAPDLLHQLHKGVFKDHNGLRIFRKGITGIQQWTGNEYRQMERVFVGAIAGMHPSQPRVLTSARAVLDFIFLAHLPSHTSSSLARLQDALATFHANKDVFVELGIRTQFNIPKLHWLFHYVPSIANLGPCDGLSTDISERLHIDYCKLGYRASNRREYIQQMIIWLTRREKVRNMESYLRWCFADPAELSLSHTTLDAAVSDAMVNDVGDVLAGAETQQELNVLPINPEHSTEPRFQTTVLALGDHSMNTGGDTTERAEDLGARDNDDNEPCGNYQISRSPGLGLLHGHAVQTLHGAKAFPQALREFILSESSTAATAVTTSNLLSATYSVYKQFTRALPSRHPTAHEEPLIDRVHACPAAGQRTASLDTILVRVGQGDADASTTGLHDCRVAQVRAIFTLPPYLQRWRTDPTRRDCHLAYIEWFTPFLAEREPTSHLYRVSRSYTNRERKAAVIPLEHIVRSCHLTPVWGDRVDQSWTSDTVLERADDFHLNEFSDHAMYCFVNNV